MEDEEDWAVIIRLELLLDVGLMFAEQVRLKADVSGLWRMI